ncbi:unnamed protein product [Rhizoctonia solani]|uniref:Uncharacterized protein n=1 Tax=Rhizoctonia solani TaxID=456999 RepID=A0A8H3ARP6_9AGAM|nr:unnamed protein product [Rhizoctonia solani]
MGPVALPILKDLTPPLQLLPKLLAYQLPRLSRLCILDILSNTQLLLVAAVLAPSHLPESIELILRVEITPTGKTGVIGRGLYRLDKGVPCIRSLRLDTYGDLVGQDDLRNMFAPVLSSFPNLEKVMFTSQSLTPDEYMGNCAQVQSDPTSSGPDLSSQSVLTFVSDAG